MNQPRSLLLGTLLLASMASAQEELDTMSADFDEGWEEDFELSDDIPVVLTASRLKQPKTEVPASVTVIHEEQIRLWGVRTLPELFRFVSGMFSDRNAVTYHTSNPNFMRRLQVLIDGRSVYKAAIADVNWQDIPLSLEDIARVEVTRGPNTAMYGANSFLGVVNIITKHPADDLGSQVSALRGNKGVQDLYARHGFSVGDTSVRISLANKADEGYDGRPEKTEETEDGLRDGVRSTSLNISIDHHIDNQNELSFYTGGKTGKSEEPIESFFTSFPDRETDNVFAMVKWKHEFSVDHQSHLQAYWQREYVKQRYGACVPTLSLDPALQDLFLINKDLADGIGLGIPYSDDIDPALITAAVAAGQGSREVVAGLLDMPITEQEYDYILDALGRIPDPAQHAQEISCGDVNTDMEERRIDIEWQDTIRWNDHLRTVSGLSYRQDMANSDTFFNGDILNDTWRAFANIEARPLDMLLLNAGGMYEEEAFSDSNFSPRLAANVLYPGDIQQSTRFVYSQAVRSPDLLESRPDYGLTMTNAQASTGGANYTGESTGEFYMRQIVDDEASLDYERIDSYEVGHYMSLADFELDVKVSREVMSDIISEPINLGSRSISNDNLVTVNGVDVQLNGDINEHHSLWIAYAYLNIEADYKGTTLSDNQARRVEVVEKRLSAKNSLLLNWGFNYADWQSSLTYMWQNERAVTQQYERWEWNVSRSFRWGDTVTRLSYFIQHNRSPDERLSYPDKMYSTPNLYYGQLSVEF